MMYKRIRNLETENVEGNILRHFPLSRKRNLDFLKTFSVKELFFKLI